MSDTKESSLTVPVSARLLRAAGMVTPGLRAADVGCDHGYVAIYLRLKGISPFCICTDINEGPLRRADENIAKYGAEGIETRLCDGLKGIGPHEAESIIITGMGGELICRILLDGNETVSAAKEMILGPQSEPEKVRNLVYRLGFGVTDEEFLLDEGKYYTLIKAENRGRRMENESAAPGETEMLYGPVLLGKRDPVLKEYLENEAVRLRKTLDNLELHGRDIPGIAKRRESLRHLIRLNNTAQEYYQ